MPGGDDPQCDKIENGQLLASGIHRASRLVMGMRLCARSFHYCQIDSIYTLALARRYNYGLEQLYTIDC